MTKKYWDQLNALLDSQEYDKALGFIDLWARRGDVSERVWLDMHRVVRRDAGMPDIPEG